jgi:1,6-anhydro-N-acetylmuramate kinase
MIYYRVACKTNRTPTWRWLSTKLNSLEALLRFLSVYRAIPPERLRVFSSLCREELNEQLARQNHGRESHSVTAAQFLQERRLRPAGTASIISEGNNQERRGRSVCATTTIALLNQGHAETSAPQAKNMDFLERRRRDLEWGAGGDHDLPYTFTLPDSWPQVHAWMRLLAQVHTHELEL